MSGLRALLLILGLVAALRLQFLDGPFQGDDAFYLASATHALVDPLHPNHFNYVAQGVEVDMRGFPKPPGNAWILAGLIQWVGDIREKPFHAAYAVFSLIAALGAWSLAGRFCSRPLLGTLLFTATPAFVVNGNSVEADVPFVALWLAAMALFVAAVDDQSRWRAAAAALLAAAAGLVEYKAAAWVPIAGLYLWRRERNWMPGWLAIAAPVAVLAGWQVFESATTGDMPAQVLGGYFQSANLQSPDNKLRNALALTVHLGWMAWPAAVIALLPSLLIPSMLFWIPFLVGLVMLAGVASDREDFLKAWIGIYFAFALVVFFAGSARYLLPVAAPVAFAVVNRWRHNSPLLIGGIALQGALSLALALANQQHWQAYRAFVNGLGDAPRVWVAGDWGLRYYAESDAAAAPLRRGQAARPGDMIISSRLGQPIEYTTGGGVAVPVSQLDVRPSIPLRLFGIGSPSAYSIHTHGLQAFEVSHAPADVVSAVAIVERKPEASYLTMNSAEADLQLLSGVFPREGQNAWRWTGQRAVALVKTTGAPASAEATFRIIDQAKARHVSLLLDGQMVADEVYTGPGEYTLRSPFRTPATGPSATVTLVLDRTFRPGADQRDLGVILTAIGLR